jgi:hypothetical protein
MKELFLKITTMSIASFLGSYLGTKNWFNKHEKN